MNDYDLALHAAQAVTMFLMLVNWCWWVQDKNDGPTDLIASTWGFALSIFAGYVFVVGWAWWTAKLIHRARGTGRAEVIPTPRVDAVRDRWQSER